MRRRSRVLTTVARTLLPLSLLTCLPSPAFPQAKLSIEKTGIDLNGGNVEPGDRIRYAITVRNENPTIDLMQVEIVDLLPASASGLPLYDVPCTCPIPITSIGLAGPVLVDNARCAARTPQIKLFGFNLVGPDPVRFEFVVCLPCDLADTTLIRNVATATASNLPAGGGPPPASVEHTVAFATLAAPAKGASPNPAAIGQDVTYTYTVTATGTGVARGVTLDDDLRQVDACFDLARGSAGCGGCYDPATGKLSASLGTVTPGTPAVVTLVLPADAAGTCTNVATVTQDSAPQICPPLVHTSAPEVVVIGTPIGCSPKPLPVSRLLAVKDDAGVGLGWQVPVPANTVACSVYKVINGDRSLIPKAHSLNVDGATIADIPACTAVPRDTAACRDPAAVFPPPALLFYQVRGACADGTEGTD